jgi:hypothetical protein
VGGFIWLLDPQSMSGPDDYEQFPTACDLVRAAADVLRQDTEKDAKIEQALGVLEEKERECRESKKQ